jgi:hypothetical protein
MRRVTIDTSAVLAMLPATRRKIMSGLGMTSICHDRALSLALQAMREAGMAYAVNVIGTEEYTWRAVTCTGYRFSRPLETDRFQQWRQAHSGFLQDG